MRDQVAGGAALIVVVVVCVALLAGRCEGYSVLTHEELIDLAWNSSIRPMLLAKFPGATEEQLRIAHSYAYGGSAVQDMGYYPFGKKFFSNLTHYVRAGDFVSWLLNNARTIDEYAFAIGALSHYLGDSIGHAEAVNLATAVEFPKLKDQYGDSVTYGESPHGHIRTEFAFDVDELRDKAFAPPTYLRYIGFRVPRKFLERAFVATYGFDIHEVLGKARPSLRSYRTAVRSFIPSFAEAELILHGKKFPPHPEDEAYKTFAQRVAQTNYDRHWKHTYKGPGIRSHLLAIVVFLVPKIGPAADLAIKIPNHETQEWYLRSVNHTVDVLEQRLNEVSSDPGGISFPNVDLDTGAHVRLGDYALADEAYEQLLERLTSRPERPIPEGVKKRVLEFYESETEADIKEPLYRKLAVLKQMKVKGE